MYFVGHETTNNTYRTVLQASLLNYDKQGWWSAMNGVPNYAVVLTEESPGETGTIAHTDDGAAVAGSMESAEQQARVVCNMMDWDDDAVEIMRVELSPVTSPVEKGPQEE